MRRILMLLVAAAFLSLQLQAKDISLETSRFEIVINGSGFVTSIFDKTGNKEYLSSAQEAPLLSIRCRGEVEKPTQIRLKGHELQLSFPQNKVETRIQVNEKSNYITFELTKITPADSVELVIWGPYPTTIKETIGECVGVVRNADFALGIQALNVKTLGGYPSEESDIEPSFDIFATGNPVDISADWKSKKHYRGQTARAEVFGSVLQAYCRNRSKDRIISNWGYTKYVAPAFHDGGVTGTKIALFGCPPGKVLETIGQIELGEGLPHPMIDGEWTKTARGATASYIITDFNEENLDSAIELTKKAGLKYLYNPGPFETWGHFALDKKAFPDGNEGLKKCVDRAVKQGIKLGVHTLSNFITTNDAYVTPVPDKRLAKVGESVLTKDIDNKADEIYIESPDFFNQMKNNSLHAVVVGSEIIRYREVSASAPWKLIGCVRGAYNTMASSHEKGDKIGKLMDHPYKVFLSNADLSEEIAKNIATLFNETGIMQTSFDGLEGVWSTGMGQYARALFVKTWYDNLNPELKGKVINDASNPGHYNWHINTRYNWGEPWYAGFRESQTSLRLMNQDFFRRNFIPAMMGWFSMSATTSIEDVEWLLARAAGFDAGFAFNVNLKNISRNGASDAIFDAIKTWETARMSGAFSKEQKLLMEDINNEYHLEQVNKKSWKLYPYKIQRYVHEQKLHQPGEPSSSTFEFDNPYNEQSMMFILSLIPAENSTGSQITRISIEVNDYNTVEIPVNMSPLQNLKLGADGKLRLFDASWNLIKMIDLKSKIPVLSPGKNKLVFDADFSGDGTSKLKIEMKTVGKAEVVAASS